MPFNNAAERQLRGVALGRKAWMFAGSDRGGERAAAMYANSTASWAWIPRHRGQRFHGMMGTDSTGSWAPG
jgi:hypothetical protein